MASPYGATHLSFQRVVKVQHLDELQHHALLPAHPHLLGIIPKQALQFVHRHVQLNPDNWLYAWSSHGR